MAKSAGGGGRRGRGRVAVGPTPGSAADVLRQRAAFRATQPAPRELGRFELAFQPIQPVKTQIGRPLPKQVLDQMNRPASKRTKFRENFATIDFRFGR